MSDIQISIMGKMIRIEDDQGFCKAVDWLVEMRKRGRVEAMDAQVALDEFMRDR